MVPKKQNNDSSESGFSGKDFASKYLQKIGFKIIDKDFKCKFGTIDIVALDNDTLVFINVKTKRRPRISLSQEVMDEREIWKIKKIGGYYSIIHPELPTKLRVDVIDQVVDNEVVTYQKHTRCD